MTTTSEQPTHAGATRSRWLRVGLPALLIVAWLAIGGIGGSFFPKIGEVSNNQQSAYLPDSAASTVVAGRMGEFATGTGIPAVIVVTGHRKLTAQQTTALRALPGHLAGIDGVAGTSSPPIISKDGAAAQILVPVTGADAPAAATAIRAVLDAQLPAGLHAWITGPAGFLADMVGALSGIDGLLLVVALLAVFLILVIVYRSPLLPVLVLATSLIALSGALLVVWWLAKWGVIMLSGQVQGILFILVIGASTDYALLYVARFRESIGEGRSRWDAAWHAWRGTIEPIAASGGTVIAGLLCLLLSDLLSNRALGPIGAIGIIFAMLAALTFLPAMLALAGRVAFWPFPPRRPLLTDDGDTAPVRGLWPRQARLVARHARIIWITCTVLLLAGASGLLQIKASGVPTSDLVVGQSQARDGQQQLAAHFPAGDGSPVYVLTPAGRAAQAIDVMAKTPGMTAISAASAASPSRQANAAVADGQARYTAPSPTGPEPAQPTVARGDVLLDVTLTMPADSDAAENAVRALRQSLDARLGAGVAKVGGTTATGIDSNDTSIRDRNLIMPVVLAVILIILMLLLRSIIAPLLLIGSVIASYAAALGVSALVFDHLFHYPGADPAVPLYAFVFLVALGVDYNIFLMTRVREESAAHGTRTGITRGLTVTGGVITSAGLVLAATFTALSVIPILFLVQIAFIVAFGVLLDTFLVRSLLIPAISHDIGRHIWWPSALTRRDPAAPAPTQQAHRPQDRLSG